jgi:hypothetical protein
MLAIGGRIRRSRRRRASDWCGVVEAVHLALSVQGRGRREGTAERGAAHAISLQIGLIRASAEFTRPTRSAASSPVGNPRLGFSPLEVRAVG